MQKEGKKALEDLEIRFPPTPIWQPCSERQGTVHKYAVIALMKYIIT